MLYFHICKVLYISQSQNGGVPFKDFSYQFCLDVCSSNNDNLSSRVPSCFYSGFNTQLTNQNKGKQYLSLWVTGLLSKTQLEMKDTANNSSFYLCGHKKSPLCWKFMGGTNAFSKGFRERMSEAGKLRTEMKPSQNQSFMLMLPADCVPN